MAEHSVYNLQGRPSSKSKALPCQYTAYGYRLLCSMSPAPELPPEIIDHILDYLGDDVCSASVHLRNASLIDNRFRQRSQGRLFGKLDLSFRDNNLDTLFATLFKNVTLRSYVQEVNLTDLDDRRYDHLPNRPDTRKRRRSVLSALYIISASSVSRLTIRRNSFHFNGTTPSPFLLNVLEEARLRFTSLCHLQIYKAVDLDIASLAYLPCLQTLEMIKVELFFMPGWQLVRYPPKPRLERLIFPTYATYENLLAQFFNLSHLMEYSGQCYSPWNKDSRSLLRTVARQSRALRTLVLRVERSEEIQFASMREFQNLGHLILCYPYGISTIERFNMNILQYIEPPSSLERISFVIAWFNTPFLAGEKIWPPLTQRTIENQFTGRHAAKWTDVKRIDFKFAIESCTVTEHAAIPDFHLDPEWFSKARELGIQVNALPTEIVETLRWPYYICTKRGPGEIVESP